MVWPLSCRDTPWQWLLQWFLQGFILHRASYARVGWRVASAGSTIHLHERNGWGGRWRNHPHPPWGCNTLCLHLPNSALGGEVGFAGVCGAPASLLAHRGMGCQRSPAWCRSPYACVPCGRRGRPMGVVPGLQHLTAQGSFVLCCSVLRAASSTIWGALLSGGHSQRHQPADGQLGPPARFWLFLFSAC